MTTQEVPGSIPARVRKCYNSAMHSKLCLVVWAMVQLVEITIWQMTHHAHGGTDLNCPPQDEIEEDCGTTGGKPDYGRVPAFKTALFYN